MKPYPIELRERVWQAVQQRQGTPIAAIAQLFQVSESFIYNLLRQWKQTGSLAPKPHRGGRPAALDKTKLAQLRQMVQEQPDATLAELQQRLCAQTRVQRSRPTICRALQKLGLKRKQKRFFARERDPGKRRAFLRRVQKLDVHKLVFIDEMGANINLSRTHARAPQAQRVEEALPSSTPKGLSVAGALNDHELLATCCLPGAFDAPAFAAFVAQMVAPRLKAGDCVVLDNVALHKSPQVTQAVESAGAQLLPLPAYSPDFDPMEPCWSKVKAYLRQLKARTFKALFKGVAAGLRRITPEDIRGWFAHCGYGCATV